MLGSTLDALLRNVSDGVILVNTEGIITHFNHAAARTLDKSPEEVIGQPFHQLTPPLDDSASNGRSVFVGVDDLLKNPSDVRPGTFKKARLLLAARLMQVRFSPVYDDAGIWGGWLLMLHDERRYEFIYNVLLEARTSITSLRGFSELLLRGAAGETNAAQEECLRTIRDNLESHSVLIEDVYTIAQIDSEPNRIRISTVHLHELLHAVLKDIQSRARYQAKSLVLTHAVEPEDLTIEADEEKLRQMLTRVIENAFNYTRSGGAVTIRIQPDDIRPGYILVMVTDTGVGIPEAFRENIWKRFERHDDTTLELEVPGTGLGLAIAKALVEMHKGHIWFESEVGAGTTFYISLPRVQSSMS